MALRPKQSICVECGVVVFKDTTGLYDATYNPDAYGTPNPNFGDVTPYEAYFFAPGVYVPGKKQALNMLSATMKLDLYDNPPAPDADGNYVWSLTPEAFGYGTNGVLKSGKWDLLIKFGSKVTHLDILIYDDIQDKIAECICEDPCKNAKMYAMLIAAQKLYSKFKGDKAQKLIERLYKDTECCSGCGGCS